MVIAIEREAPSGSKQLGMIPRLLVNNGHALLKKRHLAKWHPLKVGVIGLPGSGKSGTLALLGLVENLLDGEPVWSNMNIHASYNISDGLAWQYGADKGGIVEFASRPLDMTRLLQFDSEYRNGAVVLDEINVRLAEARRSQSNINRWFNELDQQARKLHLCIYYSVIHEMWVDTRLRDLTDIFIKCTDPAFTPKGMQDKKRPGVDVQWEIYDMLGYRTGTPYYINHKIFKPAPVHLRDYWGLWNTEEYQSTGGGDYSFDVGNSKQSESSDADWGWLSGNLTDIFDELREEGKKQIKEAELFARLQIPSSLIEEARSQLTNTYLLDRKRNSGGIYVYDVPQWKLGRNLSLTQVGTSK